MKICNAITFAMHYRMLIATASLVFITHSAFSADLNLASPYPEGSHQTRNQKLFAEDVAKATSGRVKITVHAAASLYKLPEIKRAVQTGQVALGEILLGALTNEDLIHGVGMMPFLARDLEDAKVLWSSQRRFVADRLDKQGMMLLHGVIWPGQSLFTRKQINSFADIKGLKFRVQDPNTSRLAQLIGVTGVRVETADIPQAFLTGIIDGMFTSNATTADLKGWDYIKFTYETNAWYPLNITFVNKSLWAKLDEKDRKTVLELSAKAEVRGWGMVVEETAEKTKILRNNGVSVVSPPPELLKEFQAVGKKMLDEWTAKSGPDGATLLSEFEKRRAK